MKAINQQSIKDNNMKRIYNSIYSHPGISRAVLARQTQLSKTTVSTLVDELIEREFIIDLGVSDSDSLGRKPNCLYVRTNSYYIVVMNWVEDKVHAYLIDVTGASIYKESNQLKSGETYISCSTRCIYGSIFKKFNSKRVLGICVVVSAMIDGLHTQVYSTTLSLPAMGNENLIETLGNAFPEYPVAFLEDTACYAYAEKVYAEIEENNFAFVNFSRGIGATLFIEGKMMGKASGSFTQFGHYSLDTNGPLCVCGNHGCLEVLISEHNLQKRIADYGGIPLLKNQDYITFGDLGNAVALQDETALKLVSQFAWELSQALGNLICIVNPSLIVLGGKIPALGDYFLTEVQRNLKTVGFRKMVDLVTVKYSALPSDSFIKGAMKYFFDIHFCFTDDNPPTLFIG